MEENKVSMTALLTAYARAYHAAHDTPKIFDDYLAQQLFLRRRNVFSTSRAWQSRLSSMTRNLPRRVLTRRLPSPGICRLQGGPVTLSRSRYAEDSLAEAVQQGVQQYVILGAGLDTFAFRQPEMLKRLQVFEIDQPATQAFKRKRLAELGWEIPAQLHFVPVDFSKEGLAAALQRSAYDPQKASFFALAGGNVLSDPSGGVGHLTRHCRCCSGGEYRRFRLHGCRRLCPRESRTNGCNGCKRSFAGWVSRWRPILIRPHSPPALSRQDFDSRRIWVQPKFKIATFKAGPITIARSNMCTSHEPGCRANRPTTSGGRRPAAAARRRGRRARDRLGWYR